MESRLAKELKLRLQPVAIIFTDEKPEGALQYDKDTRGCVIAMLTAASEGKVVVFDRETTGCRGGKAGLGFGSDYGSFSGGFEYFLSTGRGPGYPEGEGYKKTPELAKAVKVTAEENLKRTQGRYTYVVFKPLAQLDPTRETPQLVTFYANPDQLSALVVLANYDRPSNDNVILPFAAGCQQVCMLPYQESFREQPRAVVGITDISARPRVDADILSFTVPFKRFAEMEANIPGSFLERKAWQKVVSRIPDPPALAAE